MRTGSADLPLHGGSAPGWLFERMKRLAREISISIVINFGKEELFKRFSDPFWFQSFGCLLGFDWHSSGLTTTTTASIKEGLKDEGRSLGIFSAGGKGARGIRTPDDIEHILEKGYISEEQSARLIKASRLVAKIDSDAVQDGYSIYHHFMMFDSNGNWIVIQQGMKPNINYARRYHWASDGLESFIKDPHKGVIAERFEKPLNLVDAEISETQNKMVYFSKEETQLVVNELKSLKLPEHHPLYQADFNIDYLSRVLRKAKKISPEDFESLLLIKGIGEKMLRALALLSNLIFGTPLSFKDPALFSFAHGGKDGYPFPVEKEVYDRSIEVLRQSILSARLGEVEKYNLLKKIALKDEVQNY